MASRIDEAPDKLGNRCTEMAHARYWSDRVVRWTKWCNSGTNEPIIAKGNRFDDVEAIY